MIAKFFSYLFLWGPFSTFFKVLGRKRSLVFPLPPLRLNEPHVAVVGCGQFPFSNILPYLYFRFGAIVRRTFDTDLIAQSSLEKLFSVLFRSSNLNDIINDPVVDLVYIASPHSTHAPYASKVLLSGKSVYVEKPIAIDLLQLSSLISAQSNSNCPLFIGFNRPHSPFIKLLKRLSFESGPFFCSMVVFGHKIPHDHWYRAQGQGSRIAGNCSHWIDLAVHMFCWHSLTFPLELTLVKGYSEFPDENFVLQITSPAGSIVSLSFFAKHELHLGVTESVAFQSSSVTALIDNFKTLRVDNGSNTSVYYSIFKDVGHRNAILAPFLEDSVHSRLRMIESFLSAELTLFLISMIDNSITNATFIPSCLSSLLLSELHP